MRTIVVAATIIVALQLISCRNAPPQPQHFVLVEGVWKGKLNEANLIVTFIEGEFENYPTLAGSAYLTSDSQATAYVVTNGSHNRFDKVWFSLYRIPVADKEEYQLIGNLESNMLEGEFKQFNQHGQVIRTGAWQAYRTL